MIRRIIRLLIILAITYGVYRLVNPEWAAQLTHRIQTYFDNNKEVIEEESPAEEEPELVQETGSTDTGTQNSIYTGTIDTGWLVELDYILTNTTTQDEETPVDEDGDTEDDSQEDNKEDNEEDSEEEPETQTQTETSASSTTSSQSSSTSSSSLSEQDKQDMKNFLNAIVE